jgi:hypothetical protein
MLVPTRRHRSVGFRLTALLVLAVLAACHDLPDPVQVDSGQVVVLNQTSREWSNVEIWLNNHYRVQFPAVKAGQRLVVPLDTFVAAWGRRFDPRRQFPTGIEVTARGSDGQDVRLVWGKGRIR